MKRVILRDNANTYIHIYTEMETHTQIEIETSPRTTFV